MTHLQQPPLFSSLSDEGISPLMPKHDEAEAHTVAQLKALASPIRWKMVQILAETQGMLCVSELVDQLPRTQGNISTHLRRLHRAGLLNVRRVSHYAYYSVKPETLKLLQQQFATIAQDAQCTSDSDLP